MTPPLGLPSRHLARALSAALPLLALPTLAAAQNAADPLNLGYESATESHRGFDDEPLPAGDEPLDAPAAGAPSAETDMAAKPAGGLPAPVDPAAAGATVRDGTPAVSAPTPRARALGYDSALEDYVPYEASDEPNWVGANETVGEIGGWRTYARELFESGEASGDRAETEGQGAEPPVAAATPPASGTALEPAGDSNATRPAAARDENAVAAEPARRRPLFAYDSVLEGYAAYEESDEPNWIEANRRVGEIGGWRTYARELFESIETDGEGR